MCAAKKKSEAVAWAFISLAALRYLFVRLEASLAEMEKRVEIGSNLSITDGIIYSIARFIARQERIVQSHVDEAKQPFDGTQRSKWRKRSRNLSFFWAFAGF